MTGADHSVEPEKEATEPAYEFAEQVRALVADAPPLTKEQISNILRLLGSTG